MSEETDGRTVSDDDDPTGGGDTHWSQVAQRYYESDAQWELTTAIVYAIAEAAGVSPREVKSPPLYEIVDVSAIEDAFFRPDVGGKSRQGVGTVEFQYNEYLVKIRSDGWIQIYKPPEPGRV